MTLRGGRIQSVYSQGGTDAVAIRAAEASSIYTGAGADAVTVAATLVQSVYTGRGNDAVAISAGIVGGVYGGEGADAITVDATLGRSVADGLAHRTGGSADRAAALTGEAAQRYAALRSNIADVNGGGGNDAITVTGAEAINIAGEGGDDLMSVTGRTIGLHWGLGDGHDVVHLGAGTDILVQLGARPDGSAAPDSYTATREGDSLRLDFESGSITFVGMARAGLIAVSQGGGGTPILLNAAGAVDVTL